MSGANDAECDIWAPSYSAVDTRLNFRNIPTDFGGLDGAVGWLMCGILARVEGVHLKAAPRQVKPHPGRQSRLPIF